MGSPRKNNADSPEPEPSSVLGSLMQAYRELSPYLNLGYVFLGAVLFFTWVGWMLDNLWNTRPWLTLVGALIGIFGGFYHFFKTVLRSSDQNEQQ